MHGGRASDPGRGAALSVRIASRDEISRLPHWREAFAGQRKDHRFYELLEDTLRDDFAYGYLLLEREGVVRAIQPYFVVDQDLLAGTGEQATRVIARLRKIMPRFMRARTLMIGCAAGEGHLDADEAGRAAVADALAGALVKVARTLRCPIVVLKEFPAHYRAPLERLRAAGFTRIPSMPMTTMSLVYEDFEDYLGKALSQRTRGKIRRKLRVAERAEPPITMSVVTDVSDVIDEIYPLYEDVFNRSSLKFEHLTKEFFCEFGKRMPDKCRYFVWRQGDRIIAFSLCMVHGEGFFSEYVGFDYKIAFDLNLYYRVFHDTIEWAIGQGCTRFYSSSLNYDPKWHLRQSLYPIDLYVRHTSAPINAVFRRVLPLMEPTHADPILPNFSNYKDLWSDER